MTDPAKVLRDLAESWLIAARDPKLDAGQRAGYLRFAREFAAMARRFREQSR